MRQSNIKEAPMLTPLTIMSLDQGREFARQEMKRIYAEPAEAAAETMAPDAVEVASNEAVARKPKWRSLYAGFIGLWDPGYSVSTRRY
jgi:hypothetical protein